MVNSDAGREVKQRAQRQGTSILLSSPGPRMVYDGITLLLTHGARCFSNAYLDGLTHQQGEGVRASPLRHSVMRKPVLWASRTPRLRNGRPPCKPLLMRRHAMPRPHNACSTVPPMRGLAVRHARQSPAIIVPTSMTAHAL